MIDQILGNYIESLTLTEQDAKDWIDEHNDDDVLDDAELRDAFGALYGRPPDAEDEEVGLWSLCCAAR